MSERKDWSVPPGLDDIQMRSMPPGPKPPGPPWSRLQEAFPDLVQTWLAAAAAVVSLELGISAGLGVFSARPLGHLFLNFMMIPTGTLLGTVTRGIPAYMKQPKRYPVSDELTDRVRQFADHKELVVHIDPYDAQSQFPSTIRKGNDTLIAQSVARSLHPDQLDYLLAWQDAAFKPSVWLKAGALASVLSFATAFVGARFDVASAVLFAAMALFLVLFLSRDHTEAVDRKALDKTRNLEAAISTLWFTRPPKPKRREERLREYALSKGYVASIPPGSRS